MSTVLLDYRDDTPYKVTQSMWDGTNNEWRLGCMDILTRRILFAYHKSFHKVVTLCHVRKKDRWCPPNRVVWARPKDYWMGADCPHGNIGELIKKGGLKAITSNDYDCTIDRYFSGDGFASVSESFTIFDQLTREPYIQELMDPSLRIGEQYKPDRKYRGNFVYSWQFQTLGDLLGIDEEGHYRKDLPKEIKDAVFYCVDRDTLKAPIAEIWSMGPDTFNEKLNAYVHQVDWSVKLNDKFIKYLTKWFNYHAAKCWITQWEFINQMDWGSYPARAKHENRHRVLPEFKLRGWEAAPLCTKPSLDTGSFALTRVFGGHKKIRWDKECEYGIIVAKCQNEYRYDLLMYQYTVTESGEHEQYKPVAVLRGQTGRPLTEGVYHFYFEPSDELKSKLDAWCTHIVDDLILEEHILETTLLVYDLAPYVVAEKLNVMHTERDGWILNSDVHSEQEWNLTEKKILKRTAELIKGHKMKHVASNYDVPVYEWAATAPDKCDLMFVHKAFKLTHDDVTRRIYMLALRTFLANTGLVHSKDGRISSKKMYLRKPTPAEACLLKDRLGLDIGDTKIANLSIADVWTLCDIAKEVDTGMIMIAYQGEYMRMLTKFLETGFAKGLDELIPNGYKPSNIGDLIQLGAKAFITEFDTRYKMFKYKLGWFRSHLAIQKRKFGWYHYNGVNGMVQDY